MAQEIDLIGIFEGDTHPYFHEIQDLNAGLTRVESDIGHTFDLINKGDFEGAEAFVQAAVRSCEENDRDLTNLVDEIVRSFWEITALLPVAMRIQIANALNSDR
jgi:hypothetical protein